MTLTYILLNKRVKAHAPGLNRASDKQTRQHQDEKLVTSGHKSQFQDGTYRRNGSHESANQFSLFKSFFCKFPVLGPLLDER